MTPRPQLAGIDNALTGAGTPERAWRGWAAPTRWPVLDLTGVGELLVVEPHPDDAVLAVGGALAAAAARGVAVRIVAVTDGEASHPGSTSVSAATMAARRAEERAVALDRLGLADAPVHRLRLPDGQVAGAERALAKAIAELLPATATCLATWRGDGHPDHDAVGHASAAACQRRGAALVELPVWMWHWASPGDPRVPWARCHRLLPAAEHRDRKQAAIAAFDSQTQPLGPDRADRAILPPAVLARFRREHEVVFR